ncbi:hypothetical protein EVAR_39473_1 [Eumeta japonica]|uniref:Uncharacterized protein n=1 Tax=Eumeta variegata TaxID=151549 RepID=A0A4C1W320_EUMVA|nr:hypothetical protein EVAR_39473_1 [Eumeta japonica]
MDLHRRCKYERFLEGGGRPAVRGEDTFALITRRRSLFKIIKLARPTLTCRPPTASAQSPHKRSGEAWLRAPSAPLERESVVVSETEGNRILVQAKPWTESWAPARSQLALAHTSRFLSDLSREPFKNCSETDVEVEFFPLDEFCEQKYFTNLVKPVLVLKINSPRGNSTERKSPVVARLRRRYNSLRIPRSENIAPEFRERIDGQREKVESAEALRRAKGVAARRPAPPTCARADRRSVTGPAAVRAGARSAARLPRRRISSKPALMRAMPVRRPSDTYGSTDRIIPPGFFTLRP